MDLSRRGFLSALGGAALIPPLPAEGRRVATEPLPREPLTGTCDSNGNATIKYRAPSSFWVHCYVAIQVSAGVPNYSITLGASGVPLVFGQGAQTNLGPVLLQPGEVASITVAGATAGAAVAGQVMGWQAVDPSQLLPLLPLQPTAVSLAQSTATVSDDVTDRANRLLGQVSETPAPFMQSFKISIAALAAGAVSGAILPGHANKAWHLYNGLIGIDTVDAATIFALRSDPTFGDGWLFSQGTLAPQPFDFRGTAITAGDSVTLKNYGTVAHSYNGWVIAAEF